MPRDINWFFKNNKTTVCSLVIKLSILGSNTSRKLSILKPGAFNKEEDEYHSQSTLGRNTTMVHMEKSSLQS